MSIFKKLQQARVMLQQMPMKKSGKNTFAKYEYFELGDFLPNIQSIFNEVGLCGVVSFSRDMAELWIHETDGDGKIVFTSPMADADLKGCHAIQNLGAVQTYQRRYLWMSALEIVEHDALDAVTGNEKPKQQPQQKAQTQTIDISEHKTKLESATNMQELISVWQIIPKNLHKQLEGVKNAMKTKLTPQNEAA